MIPALPIINEFVGTPEEVSEFQIAINRNDFQQSTTFRQQIGIICMHLHNDFINVSYSRIVLGISITDINLVKTKMEDHLN